MTIHYLGTHTKLSADGCLLTDSHSILLMNSASGVPQICKIRVKWSLSSGYRVKIHTPCTTYTGSRYYLQGGRERGREGGREGGGSEGGRKGGREGGRGVDTAVTGKEDLSCE